MSKRCKIIIIYAWFIALGFNPIIAAAGAYCSLLPSLIPSNYKNKLTRVTNNPLILIAAIILVSVAYYLSVDMIYAQYVQYLWLVTAALAVPPLIDAAAKFIGIKAGSPTEHIAVWGGLCVFLIFRIIPLDTATLRVFWQCNKIPMFFAVITLATGSVMQRQASKRKTLNKEPRAFNLETDLHKAYIGTPAHPLYNKGLHAAKNKKKNDAGPPQEPAKATEQPEQEKETVPPQQKAQSMSEPDTVAEKKAPVSTSETYPDKIEQRWKHADIDAAHKFLWQRYSNVFSREPESWEIITALFEILDADEADVSSVRSNDSLESNDPAFQALQKISLRRHTLNVLRAVISAIQHDPILEGTSLSGALIAALGHDLGKLGRFEDYMTGDHPANGEKIVAELLEKYANQNIAKLICEAIAQHHVAEVPNNIIHDLLRQADFAARNAETAETMGKDNHKKSESRKGSAASPKTGKVKTQTLHKHQIKLPDNYPLEAFRKRLRTYSNFPKTTVQKYWKSVTQPDGYVYFNLDLFDELIREVAIKEGITEYDIIKGNDKVYGAARMTAVYGLLRDAGWDHPRIKKGYFANTWKVQDKMYNWEGNLVLVALKVQAVGEENVLTLEKERQEIPRLRFIKILGTQQPK